MEVSERSASPRPRAPRRGTSVEKHLGERGALLDGGARREAGDPTAASTGGGRLVVAVLSQQTPNRESGVAKVPQEEVQVLGAALHLAPHHLQVNVADLHPPGHLVVVAVTCIEMQASTHQLL